MKKHLSLLFALLISACSGSATSVTSSISSEPVVYSSTESTTSLVDSTSTSSTSVISSESSTPSSISSSSSLSSFTSASSVSSSSSISSSTTSSSSSTSISSSTSSNSSSQGGEQPLSSLEAFNLFHEGLNLKNSTYVDEEYIEQKLIGDKILANHYYGKFADQGDDGYVVYLDQGLYKYSKNDISIEIGDCKSLSKDTRICEFFYTTYDLLDYKSKWKATSEDFVYTSTNLDLGGLIADLDGQGIFASVTKSCKSTLTVSEDGLSATYKTELVTDGYGNYTMSFVVKDLGTTTDEGIEEFLNTALPLESTNDFPSEVKESLDQMVGSSFPVPSGISYAHMSSVFYSSGVVAQVTYEDLLIGNQVDSYRQSLLDAEFTYSDITDESGDLKQLGYIRYYYEKTVDSSVIYVELFYLPKVNLEEYEQTLFPNGIFHIRVIKQ